MIFTSTRSRQEMTSAAAVHGSTVRHSIFMNGHIVIQGQAFNGVGGKSRICSVCYINIPAIFNNISCRAAAGDEYSAPVVHGGAVCYAANIDGQIAAAVHGGAVRYAAAGDEYSAPVVHGGAVRYAAAGDSHPAAAVHSGAVRYAAAGDVHVTTI